MSNYQNPLLNEKMRLIRFRMKKENLRFTDEIRLIPKWLIWTVVSLFIVAQAVTQAVYSVDPNSIAAGGVTGKEGALLLAAAVTGVSILLAGLIFLIGYVYSDARRRGMNAGLWTLLTIILLPAWLLTGFVIYFLVREPLPYHCTQCGATVSARFNYCPNCKYNLRPTCQQCQREVGEFDRYCPHCGFAVTAAAQPEVSPGTVEKGFPG